MAIDLVAQDLVLLDPALCLVAVDPVALHLSAVDFAALDLDVVGPVACDVVQTAAAVCSGQGTKGWHTAHQ